MYFKRKVYNELLEWKKTYSDKYAVLPEVSKKHIQISYIIKTFPYIIRCFWKIY